MGTSRVEMTRCALCFIIEYYAIALDTNQKDFLHRFRANLADFESLNLNRNSLTYLANIEAAEACQDAINANQCFQNWMDLKRLLKVMMNHRLFIQKRLFLHKRGSSGNMARVQENKRSRTDKDKTFYLKQQVLKLLQKYFHGSQHREKNPAPSLSYQGKNRGDYPTMEKNSAVDENIDEYPAVEKYPFIKDRAEYLPIEKNSVTGKDKDAEEYIEEEGYIRESAPRKRYPTMMNSNDSKRGDENGDKWMKYQDNLNTLQEMGEDDQQKMFDNLEKSWKLINQPGVKIIPIPRIG